jgi:hypothetical protein
MSIGLAARMATARSSDRSERIASVRRHGLPLVRGAAGSGGICMPRKRLAARRSARSSQRQPAAEASRSGNPIRTTLSAAPSITPRTAQMPGIAITTLAAR